jgi:hypothetical protein
MGKSNNLCTFVKEKQKKKKKAQEEKSEKTELI